MALQFKILQKSQMFTNILKTIPVFHSSERKQ